MAENRSKSRHNFKVAKFFQKLPNYSNWVANRFYILKIIENFWNFILSTIWQLLIWAIDKTGKLPVITTRIWNFIHKSSLVQINFCIIILICRSQNIFQKFYFSYHVQICAANGIHLKIENQIEMRTEIKAINPFHSPVTKTDEQWQLLFLCLNAPF